MREIQGIVMTGASSMLGLALIDEALRRHVRVLAIVRRDSKKADRIPHSDLVTVVEADLNELDGVPDMASVKETVESGAWDAFFHFGWESTTREGRSNIEGQLVNVEHTMRAVRLAAALGCRVFVGAGSQAEYGLKDLDKISPETPVDPVVPYGICKYAAGKLGKLLAEQLGIDFIWTRIFSVFGVHDNPTTMLISAIAALHRGERMAFTAGEQRWDYLYSEDAVRALFMLAQSGKSGELYCIGSGKPRLLRDYLEAVRQVVNPDGELGIGERPYPPGCVMNICADISKLTRDTGWEPEIPFEEGVRRMYAAMKEKGWLQ